MGFLAGACLDNPCQSDQGSNRSANRKENTDMAIKLHPCGLGDTSEMELVDFGIIGWPHGTLCVCLGLVEWLVHWRHPENSYQDILLP